MTTKTKKQPARKSVPAPEKTRNGTTAVDASPLTPFLPTGYRMVSTAQLVPHPDNPRRDLGDLTELAASIKEQGVKQNLTVVPDDGDPERFLIVIGHRRAAAAMAAGLDEVPAVVDPTLGRAQQLELMLVENVHRSQLTVVEEADGYQAILDEGLSRAALAKAVGVSKSTVATRLSLAGMPPPVKEKIHVGQGTFDDALKLEEARDALDEAAYAELEGKFGSAHFQWDVQRELQVAAARKERAEFVAKLAERGAVEVEAGDTLPDGYRYDYKADPFDETADVGSWRYKPTGYGRGADVYTLGGPTGAAEPAVESEEERAAREAREAEDTAVRTASQLRNEFLQPLIRGERKLTKAQSDRVLREFVLTVIQVGDYIDATSVVAWLDDLDLDDPTTVESIGIPRLALAGLAAHNEGRPEMLLAQPWQGGVRTRLEWNDGWGANDEIVAWYQFLTDLGYEASPPELDRLAMTADDQGGEQE